MKFKQINEQLRVSLDGKYAAADLRASIPVQEIGDETKKVLAEASLWYGDKRSMTQDNVTVPQRMPALTDDRYVFAKFRALSQVHLVSRGLDFTRPGVLEAGVPMLYGRTVYLNHDFSDVDNWVGVVSKSFWDAEGANSGGTPGINCEVKIDAYLNYRTACGVTMNPPAVNSMSLTIMFEFEYSHPELVDERRFWNLLGEEVDGEIVRLIVTQVNEIFEASLVPIGEDRKAKNHGTVAQTDEDEESFSAEDAETAADDPPPNSNEEKTMKLSKEQKTSLGIEFDGEDVPEAELLKAAESLAARVAEQPADLAELKTQAAAGLALVAEKRTEVTRLAKLAELGAEEGDLDEVVVDQINSANAESLIKLEKYYGDKAATKFPKGGRSSLENSDDVDAAGGVKDVEMAVGDDPTAGLL